MTRTPKSPLSKRSVKCKCGHMKLKHGDSGEGCLQEKGGWLCSCIEFRSTLADKRKKGRAK